MMYYFNMKQYNYLEEIKNKYEKVFLCSTYVPFEHDFV